ncbi:hypothetical protein N9B93_01160 [Candidatus Pelagibacter ubique]|nr:hypothetical protein [Candidatus Pelagibacter ubique]
MATINLGSIKFNWKGTYAGGTAYVADDVVSYNGSSYICILASTGNLPTNATYWEQMSSAGTNGTDGTDLGTTLTTQGDLVYRDGSGLQRLGAGTSGQVLQTGGTGANPSWGTVSSDFVKIAGVEATSGSKISFDNVFATGTYKSYQLKISRFRPSTGSWTKFYFRDSGSDITNSYYWQSSNHYGNSSGVGSDLYKDWNGGYAVINYWSTDNSYDFVSVINLGNPAVTSGHKVGNAYSTTQTGSEIMTVISGWSNNNSTVTNGCDGCSIELSNTGYSMNNVDIELYGLK